MQIQAAASRIASNPSLTTSTVQSEASPEPPQTKPTIDRLELGVDAGIALLSGAFSAIPLFGSAVHSGNSKLASSSSSRGIARERLSELGIATNLASAAVGALAGPLALPFIIASAALGVAGTFTAERIERSEGAVARGEIRSVDQDDSRAERATQTAAQTIAGMALGTLPGLGAVSNLMAAKQNTDGGETVNKVGGVSGLVAAAASVTAAASLFAPWGIPLFLGATAISSIMGGVSWGTLDLSQ